MSKIEKEQVLRFEMYFRFLMGILDLKGGPGPLKHKKPTLLDNLKLHNKSLVYLKARDMFSRALKDEFNGLNVNNKNVLKN